MNRLPVAVLLVVSARAGPQAASPATVGYTLDSYPTLQAAFSAAAGSGSLLITKTWQLTAGIKIDKSLGIRCSPSARIVASASDFTMFTVTGDNVSFDGCTMDGNSSKYARVNPVTASGTSHFKFTNGIIQNVNGIGIHFTGRSTTDAYVGHSQFLNFGNGTVAGSVSDCIQLSDFTSATLEGNYFSSNTSSNFIYATNTVAPGAASTLAVSQNRGTRIGRMAFEVQLYGSGSITSRENHFDTALNGNVFCISLGVLNGSTPNNPVQGGSSSTDDSCLQPGGTHGMAAGVGFEVYANGMSIKGLQIIGPWGVGMLMGSQNLRVSDSLFDHNLKFAIEENGTDSGTGWKTDHLMVQNVIINEPRDQGTTLCSFDCSGDKFDGVHFTRTPGAWDGDSRRKWYAMGWANSPGARVRTPFQVLHSDVTFPASDAGEGFVAIATGQVGGAYPGSSYDGLSVYNLGAAPFGQAHYENAGGYYNGESIVNATYMNLGSVSNIAPNDTLHYGNNRCAQGSNSTACGARGGPALDKTVTPTP